MEMNAQGAENVQNNEGNRSEEQSEKLFTQDDVNRIVGERLSRAKNTRNDKDTADREAMLDQREIRLDAREKLADLGISKDLLPLVNCTSKETMDSSIKLIAEQFKKPSSKYRIVTGVCNTGNGSGHGKGLSDSEIRSAMGLKGR